MPGAILRCYDLRSSRHRVWSSAAALTIHSSRHRFAARLNSGVRTHANSSRQLEKAHWLGVPDSRRLPSGSAPRIYNFSVICQYLCGDVLCLSSVPSVLPRHAKPQAWAWNSTLPANSVDGHCGSFCSIWFACWLARSSRHFHEFRSLPFGLSCIANEF